jgi:hypothetical protein
MIFSFFITFLSSKVGVYFRQSTNMDTSTLLVDVKVGRLVGGMVNGMVNGSLITSSYSSKRPHIDYLPENNYNLVESRFLNIIFGWFVTLCMIDP